MLVGCLLFFRLQRFVVAWTLVHRGPVCSTELHSQPLGARHAARGGERPRASGAPRRLVAVQPLVDVALTDDVTVIDWLLVNRASSSQQQPFIRLQRLQCSATLLASKRARVLHTHPCAAEAIHRSAHSASHKQSSRRVRRISTQALRFPRAAGEMPNPLCAPSVIDGVADLASGRHADALLVCASFCGVSRSIHPPHAVLALLDRCAPLAAEKNPKRRQAKHACTRSAPPVSRVQYQIMTTESKESAIG